MLEDFFSKEYLEKIKNDEKKREDVIFDFSNLLIYKNSITRLWIESHQAEFNEWIINLLTSDTDIVYEGKVDFENYSFRITMMDFAEYVNYILRADAEKEIIKLKGENHNVRTNNNRK